jgi:hypothetical protein
MDKHSVYKKYKDLHHPAGTREGGKCMVRCEYIYKQRNSCSYRWQALKWIDPGGADRDIYKSHSKGLSGTDWRSVSPSYAAKLSAAGALVTMTAPAPIKSGKMRSNVQGVAFRTAFAPYPNQAHHLLPEATLKNGILEVTQPAPTVQDLIVQGLLEKKYNLNHYENVMILPTGRKDGCQMGLPCHPTNHNKMDKQILKKVLEALKPYQAVVKAVLKDEDHPNPDPEDIKDDLEEIGKTIHKNIVSDGERNAIKALCASGGDIEIDSLAPKVASWLGV